MNRAQVIERLEEDLGAGFVGAVLGLIACSWTGLAERELADWVRHHIVRIDTQLRECVLRKSAPAAELETPRPA